MDKKEILENIKYILNQPDENQLQLFYELAVKMVEPIIPFLDIFKKVKEIKNESVE